MERPSDAFIHDHVRTPRGRGKVDGALQEVTALDLDVQTLKVMGSRNELDTILLDDVVMGVVDPVGEAGANITRTAALVPGYGDSVAGVQINRFCASGLDAGNFATAQIMAGQQDMAIGGVVESMSRGASVRPAVVRTTVLLKTHSPLGIKHISDLCRVAASKHSTHQDPRTRTSIGLWSRKSARSHDRGDPHPGPAPGRRPALKRSASG